jgi:pimeloyl-ACP methyl ester carboxylesterase
MKECQTLERDYVVDGRRLEAIHIPAIRPELPTIVLLHEGLGSVGHWKDFPRQLAERTEAGLFVYSRYGHGNSERLDSPRPVSYMHHEAQVVLPEILRQSEIETPVLLGHSDGASIAIIYAGTFPESPAAIVLEAPHVFVENITVESIARAKIVYETTDLAEKLGRYHAHVDSLFWGWNNIWLDPAFRGWNIESYLDTIRCPVLVLQGAQDEYGTVRQIDAIRARIPSAEWMLLENCKHAPHRDQTEMVLQEIGRFLNKCLSGRLGPGR